jgi:hypothetical protein
VGDAMMAHFREVGRDNQPDLLGPSRAGMFEYDPPWPGTLWILEAL